MEQAYSLPALRPISLVDFSSGKWLGVEQTHICQMWRDLAYVLHLWSLTALAAY